MYKAKVTVCCEMRTKNAQRKTSSM